MTHTKRPPIHTHGSPQCRAQAQPPIPARMTGQHHVNTGRPPATCGGGGGGCPLKHRHPPPGCPLQGTAFSGAPKGQGPAGEINTPAPKNPASLSKREGARAALTASAWLGGEHKGGVGLLVGASGRVHRVAFCGGVPPGVCFWGKGYAGRGKGLEYFLRVRLECRSHNGSILPRRRSLPLPALTGFTFSESQTVKFGECSAPHSMWEL